MPIASPRKVARVVSSERHLEGAGFPVRRPFPSAELSDIDPFLLLDHLGPVDYAPGAARGAPDHPHRGFETVTYLLEGQMQHRDSAGHSGRLTPGDVQWMTAGAGVVHSEMPSDAMMRDGGRLHGFQIWVNLPRADKMMPPRYQEIPAARLPLAEAPDGSSTVRVIAGSALGARAVIDTRTPILFLHCTLRPGARLSLPADPGQSLFAYVVEGRGLFGPESRAAGEGDLALFERGGDGVLLAAEAGPAPGGPGVPGAPGALGLPGALSVLLVGGAPLREPVARYGPFVMNTREEILQAIDDYQSGRMGRIGG